ncbi:predicted protein [Streptomyces albidoflavus]|nr:predicted protein [Streptomyces albidoflavus]
MGSSTAGRKLFRRPGGRHVLVTVLVAVAVLAYLVLLPSDEVAPVPGSPCRADGPARTDPLLAPDLDGDGFGELAYEDAREPDGFQVVVVPGSARGPDAARATVLDRADLGVPDSVQSIDDTWRPTVADPDGDGPPRPGRQRRRPGGVGRAGRTAGGRPARARPPAGRAVRRRPGRGGRRR